MKQRERESFDFYVGCRYVCVKCLRFDMNTTAMSGVRLERTSADKIFPGEVGYVIFQFEPKLEYLQDF